MADEIKPDDSAVVVEVTTPVEVAAPKKRGPRAKKVASDVASQQASASPKVVKRGRKAKEKPADLKVAEPSTAVSKDRVKGAAKATGKRTAAVSSAESSVSALDEIADLLQLEEENARLRKTLAEKLRTENADLRKRLGLA